MATRFYFSSGPIPRSFTVDSSWELDSATRRRLDFGKVPLNALATFANATTLNSPAGAVDVCQGQFISEPLSGNQTISGAIKGRMRAQSSNAAADLRSQCVIRVIAPDGTVRGTLVASDASALASEWGTALANRKMPLGSPATPTTVNALDGDLIVVEVGYRKHESAVTSRTGTLSYGNPAGTDLPEDETTTTAGIPWIEFADTLTFITPMLVTQVGVEVIVLPTSQKARISQIGAEIIVKNHRVLSTAVIVG